MRRATPLLMALALIACSTLPGKPPVHDRVAAPLSADPAPLPAPPAASVQPPAAKPAAPALVPTCPPAAVAEPAPSGKSPAGDRQVLMDEALDFVQAAQEFWQKGELDQALEALDKAYSLILQEDCENVPKLIQQREDLRYLIAKRILEIYASRNIVVNGHHNAIPRVRNEHVDAELKRFEGPERDFFRAAYKRSGRYRPYFVKALREAGLPEELSWLPLIESGFKVNALSRARALGLWQFIPSTGYKFGLKRDVYVDERLDPVKSTQAAIAYLKELHSIFGDWITVLAAYNCGEGRVLRIIRSQNVNYLDNFWDLYERLPRETARYVPRFLATLHVVGHPKAYGLHEIPLDTPPPYETVTVARRVHLKDVARAIGTDEEALRELNPELRYRIAPGEDYALRVPPGSGETLLASLDRIPVSEKPRRPLVYHRVRRGETLSTIARRYHTSVKDIMSANGLHHSNFIVAGRSIKVPARSAPSGAASLPAARPGGGTSRHTVKSGDSLWILARQYGTTVRQIQAANGLPGTRLDIGQKLLIPGEGQPTPDPQRLKVHRVRKGDTPFMIAKRYKMPLERLLRINRLTPRCTIYPGQRLYVD